VAPKLTHFTIQLEKINAWRRDRGCATGSQVLTPREQHSTGDAMAAQRADANGNRYMVQRSIRCVSTAAVRWAHNSVRPSPGEDARRADKVKRLFLGRDRRVTNPTICYRLVRVPASVLTEGGLIVANTCRSRLKEISSRPPDVDPESDSLPKPCSFSQCGNSWRPQCGTDPQHVVCSRLENSASRDGRRRRRDDLPGFRAGV
jgi:hypothetical protein